MRKYLSALSIVVLATISSAHALDVQATKVPGRAPPSLSDGEIATNRADGRLFYKTETGAIAGGLLPDLDASGYLKFRNGMTLGRRLSNGKFISTPDAVQPIGSVSLIAKGCVDDGATANPTDNYATCILPAINELVAKGGGDLLIDGFFANSQAVPLRSNIRYMPRTPGVSGFIAHPSSTDNVLGEAHPPGDITITKPYFGAGLVIDGNKDRVAWNTRGTPGNPTAADDAYQNGVRLAKVVGLEAPHLIIRNTVFNGYSDYFYGTDNHVGRLVLRNIGKAGDPPAGSAKSYNGAWIEFQTTRSTIDYIDADGIRDRGYFVTTGYPTAYADAVQISPALLGGRIRNTGGDAITVEITGGDYGFIKDLRILDVDIGAPTAPGAQGVRLATPSTNGNNGISNAQVRVTVNGATQHGVLAYGNVTFPRIEGQSLANGGAGVVLGEGVKDATLGTLVSLGNAGGNLIDQGLRTRRGLGVVTDQGDMDTITRALGIASATFPQLQIRNGGDVGFEILREGVVAFKFKIQSDGKLYLYQGGNQVDAWPK